MLCSFMAHPSLRAPAMTFHHPCPTAVRNAGMLCRRRHFPSVLTHLDEHWNNLNLSINPLITGVGRAVVEGSLCTSQCSNQDMAGTWSRAATTLRWQAVNCYIKLSGWFLSADPHPPGCHSCFGYICCCFRVCTTNDYSVLVKAEKLER